MKEIKMTFKCPKCGGTKLRVVQRYAEMSWEVDEIVKDEYGISVAVKGGGEFPDDAEVLEEYFCCSHCGEVITDGDDDDAFIPTGEEDTDA